MSVQPAPRRVFGLDVLRGLAALVVVIHHQLLTSPIFDRAYVDPHASSLGTAQWWLTYSPAHFFWDGGEAVFVFFVLSGYVLTLPTLSRSLSLSWWASYYIRRLVRLYLPVLGAVLFALAMVAIVHRRATSTESNWLAAHATNAHGVSAAIDQIGWIGGTGWLNSPLWSLKYEIMFSVLFPLFIYVGRWLPLRGLQLALLLGVIVAGSYLHSESVEYLPMFGIGVVLALQHDTLTQLAAHLRRQEWAILTTVAALLLSSRWYIYASGSYSDWLDTGAVVATAAISVAAGVLVFVCAYWPAANRLVDLSPARRLGQLSFSLYLTHEPVIVSVAFALHSHLSTWLLLLIATPLSLAVAYLFFTFVEAPSHGLSQYLGRAGAQRATAVRARWA